MPCQALPTAPSHVETDPADPCHVPCLARPSLALPNRSPRPAYRVEFQAKPYPAKPNLAPPRLATFQAMHCLAEPSHAWPCRAPPCQTAVLALPRPASPAAPYHGPCHATPSRAPPSPATPFSAAIPAKPRQATPRRTWFHAKPGQAMPSLALPRQAATKTLSNPGSSGPVRSLRFHVGNAPPPASPIIPQPRVRTIASTGKNRTPET